MNYDFFFYCDFEEKLWHKTQIKSICLVYNLHEVIFEAILTFAADWWVISEGATFERLYTKLYLFVTHIVHINLYFSSGQSLLWALKCRQNVL